jgi:hypothetical protein
LEALAGQAAAAQVLLHGVHEGEQSALRDSTDGCGKRHPAAGAEAAAADAYELPTQVLSFGTQRKRQRSSITWLLWVCPATCSRKNFSDLKVALELERERFLTPAVEGRVSSVVHGLVGSSGGCGAAALRVPPL